MGLVIEAVDAKGVVTQSTVDAGGSITVPAVPGTTYRIVDQSGRAIGGGPRAVQIDGNLVVDALPGSETVTFVGFFTDCTPQAPCQLSLEELGGSAGETITPASEPVAALTQGGFLMNRTGATSTSIPQEPGSEFNWKPIAAGVGGLVVVAGVAGGGGGGGGTDTTAPAAPTLKSEIGNTPLPLLEGTAEANSTVSVTINIGGSGQTVGYTTVTNASGNWAVDTATAQPLSGTLPPGGLPTDTPSPVSIQARDAAGNLSQPLTTALSIDTEPPAAQAAVTTVGDDVGTIIGSVATNGFTDDAAPLLSGTLSAPLGPEERVEISRDGSVIGDAVVSNLDWQYAETGLTDGAHVYSVQVIDSAGNASAASAAITINVDTVAPAAAVIAAVATDDLVNLIEASAGITLTGTAEAGAAVEVTWAGTVARSLQADQTTGIWSTVYQAAQLPPDGVANVTAIAIDLAGNTSTAAVRPVTVDQQDASLAITSSASGVTNQAVTITFVFEEPVTGFVLNDIVVTGATPAASLVAAPGGTEYTLAVTPLAATEGNATITVAAGAAQNAAGNDSAAASVVQAFDTAKPVLTITDNATAAQTSQPVLFTFSFSEPVTGLTAAEIVVTGGTKGALNPATGPSDTYTMIVTPTVAATSVGVSVAAGAAQDAAGNTSTADSAQQGIDLTAPTLAITNNVANGAAANSNAPVLYTFTFSEAVTGFASNDITVTNASKGAFTTVTAGSVYTLLVTPDPNEVGNIGVSVRAAAALDAALNPSPLTLASPQAFDTTVPTVVITDNATGVTNAPVTYTFTWSEAVTGFAFADIQPIVNGSAVAGNFSSVSATQYELVVTPATDIEDNMTVTVSDGAVTDTAGNLNAVTTSPTQAIDTQRPQLTMTDDTPLDAVGPFEVTFAFSEALTPGDFTLADIAITSDQAAPTFGSLVTVDSNTFTLEVTPATTGVDGTITIAVAANIADDLAGNGNLPAVDLTQDYVTGNTAGMIPELTTIGLDQSLGGVI